MVERAECYGRYMAGAINYILETIPELQREDYKRILIGKIKMYSSEKKDISCADELADIPNFEILNPEHFAELIKGQTHNMRDEDKAVFLETILANID